jgi:hypothetical protein
MEEANDSSLTILVVVSDMIRLDDSSSNAVLLVMVINVEMRAHNESGVCVFLIQSIYNTHTHTHKIHDESFKN